MIKLKLFNQEKINYLLKEKERNFILIDFKMVDNLELNKNENYIFINLLEASNDIFNLFLKKINLIYSEQNSYFLFYKFYIKERVLKIDNLSSDIDILDTDIDLIYQKIVNNELKEVIDFIGEKEFETKKKIYYLLGDKLKNLKDKKLIKNLFDNNEKDENLVLFIHFLIKKTKI